MLRFLILLAQELRLAVASKSRALSGLLFFIIFLTTVSLLNRKIDSIVIYLCLMSGLIFSSSEFLKRDFEDGTTKHLLLACSNFETVIAAKMFGNWMINCLPVCLFALVLRWESEFFFLLMIGSLGMNFICCFCGSLSVLGNSAPLIAMIAMPLIIPILLISNADLDNIGTLITSITIFSGGISIFATSQIIKIAHE